MPGPRHRAEIGYWVAPWARGQGVATRAARALCDWVLSQTVIERIHLEAAVGNPASNAVAHRLGFTHEGTLRGAAVLRATETAEEERADMHVWGLLRGELI